MNAIFDFFTSVPLEMVFIITCILVFLAFEGGVFLGKKHRSLTGQEDETPLGSIVGATLGLLAFLLAFTFGIAVAKFDSRRELVVDEANAINTTYLRAGYLERSRKEKIRNFLKEYIVSRLEAVNSGKFEQGVQKSEDLQNRLWEQALALAEQNPNSETVALFIESLNEVINLHEKRVILGMHFRIPFIIWSALYFVALLAIGSLGYQIGITRTQYSGISLLLIITFSSVITLIIDLDRPQEGFIKISQQALVNLLDRLNKAN